MPFNFASKYTKKYYNIKLYYWGGYIIAILFISYPCKDFKINIGE